MTSKRIAGLLVVAALALSGCQDALDSAAKAERPLPPAVIQAMKAKGMTRSSPVMVRIFKEEGKLEVWKRKDTGRYDIIANYDICKWSGKLGPKYMEGDRQAPEGFYTVRPWQMNPNSSYYLSFNMGYPNAFDRAHGRTGSNLMVHGACSSAGCYSMSDEQVAEIFAFARDSFRGGQTEFQVQAFPFRMTAANMARYAGDPNIEFWKMLKVGYDHFELTRVPPKVDVCGRRYVFNQIAEEGYDFKPTAACPPMSQPDNLRLAYENLEKQNEEVFSSAVSTVGYSSSAPRRPSIQGPKEAALVAAWSKKRARGERVSREPPSLSLTPAVAPLPAAKPEDEPVAKAPEAAQAPRPVAAAEQSQPIVALPAADPRETEAEAKAEDGSPVKSRLKKIINLFGG